MMTTSLSKATVVLFGLLALAGPWHGANALDPEKTLSQYVHTTWRMDDGLPHSGITRMLQTRDGFLWVGTQAGIARFDGVRFSTFDHTNTPELQDGFITDLFEDRHGTLWIGTLNSGVVEYRDGRFSRLASIGARDGYKFADDLAGGLWIGGAGGLSHMQKGAITRTFAKSSSFAGGTISQLAMEANGSLWIGTSAGLYVLRGSTLTAYLQQDGLPNNLVTQLHLDTDGSVWVKTHNADTVILKNGRFKSWRAPKVAGANVRDFLRDRDGSLWVSSADGLVRITASSVTSFTAKDGLSSDAMTSLYEDRDGNIWAGTNGGGLDRFKQGSFTTYSATEGLSGDQTYAVAGDLEGNIWVTTPTGLNRIDHNGAVQILSTADGSEPTAILSDRESGLLIGSSSGGMWKLAAGRLSPALTDRSGILGYFISAAVRDSRGNLWIGPRGGGLARYSDGNLTRQTPFTLADAPGIYSLAETSDGTVWAGSTNGLLSFKDGKYRAFEDKRLTGAFVGTLFVDHLSVLWIGTFGRGLFKLENGKLTNYTAKHGLLDDNVNSIVEDTEHNLWIGSDHGVSRVGREKLVASTDQLRLEPTHFGRPDGMKSSETMGGTQSSAWRGRDGRLWFPTSVGVSVVDPSRLNLDLRTPMTIIEEVIADQQPTSIRTPLDFKPGMRRLEIRFTAPSISSPQRIQFRYRLDGFDTDWIHAGKQRVAQYTNLAPGKYSFKVSARSATGPWSTRETTLAINLQPRFYQTRWFQALCALSILLLLWAAYRLRVNWLHARAAVHEERQRIARNIHDSLAQSLSGIIFLTQAAMISLAREPKMSHAHMDSALELAKSGLDEARYSVWDLSTAVLNDKDLVESLQSMARQLARGRVEELDIHSSGTEWEMRPASSHHVLMIAQEAISNAIKHGHAGMVSVKLTYTPEALHLLVADDGVGFIPGTVQQQSTHGYGIRNMHHRAGRIGASLLVTSEVGVGTQVALRMPRVSMFARFWRRLLGQSTGVDA